MHVCLVTLWLLSAFACACVFSNSVGYCLLMYNARMFSNFDGYRLLMYVLVRLVTLMVTVCCRMMHVCLVTDGYCLLVFVRLFSNFDGYCLLVQGTMRVF
jgi:hypothetical protein